MDKYTLCVIVILLLIGFGISALLVFLASLAFGFKISIFKVLLAFIAGL